MPCPSLGEAPRCLLPPNQPTKLDLGFFLRGNDLILPHTCKKIMDLDLKDRDHLSDLDLLV